MNINFSIELNVGVFHTVNKNVAFDGYVGGQKTMNTQVYQEFTQNISFSIINNYF